MQICVVNGKKFLLFKAENRGLVLGYIWLKFISISYDILARYNMHVNCYLTIAQSPHLHGRCDIRRVNNIESSILQMIS